MDKNANGNFFGFLNIDKPKGMTSHDVVSRCRKLFGIKQIGHTGTLDPFATGVLPVALGKATKLIEYLSDDKKYMATIKFGANTDTYDVEGNITETFSKKITQVEVEAVLNNFKGEISQMPPIYSAIKIRGKKLYEYARAGESVDITPRMVTVYEINLEAFDNEKQQAQILVSCSKGTYIRSLAYDMGKMLGCGGYLVQLRRLRAGKFDIKESVNLDAENDVSEYVGKIINPIDVLDNPVCVLTEYEKEKIIHGMAIQNKGFKNSDIVFLVYGDRIHGIGAVAHDKILVKKVFEVL